MDDIYDIAGFEDFGDDADLPPTIDMPVVDPTEYYERSQHYWMQVPMPPEYAPTGGAPLADLDDETLLTMSPTLLLHAQRTAALGGLQVVSPRAVPLACAAAHTALPHRTTDMFIAGSIASRNMDWPTVGEPVPEHLFPDEPIDGYPAAPALRPTTKTVGIAAAAKDVADPVVRAFLIGRALVDLQRRPDVAGAGDALSAHIAASWGLPVDTYDGMAEASLAPMGSLLRYATRSDTAYPMLNAPIHARKCISVGANTAGRVLYGEHAAIDWRRIRVLCEAVFYISSRVEGWGLSQLALQQPPGDPRANPNRAGVLQMRPMPGSVWTHDPASFRLDIERMDPPPAAIEFPDRIAAAVDEFYRAARPVAITAWAGESINLVPTVSKQPTTATRELVITGFQRSLQLASDFSARGKTSAAAVRDYVYQSLAGNSSLAAVRTLWLARYLRESAEACGLVAQLDTVLTRQLAARLSDYTTDLRIRLSVESNRRGATLEAWWDDVRSLLPSPLHTLSEGSASWAIAVSHFLIHPYSAKWANLTRALAVASHQAMASGALHDVKLPAAIGSRERVFEAGAATTRSLANSYGAYYSAMYEVGCMLAAQMKRVGNSVAAYKIRVAANMWDIRAKAAASVRLHPDDGTAAEAGVIPARTGPYHFTTAPYAAYNRWREHLASGRIVSMDARRTFPHHVAGPVSSAFAGRRDALFPMGTVGHSRLFRYTSRPADLAADITRTLLLMSNDVAAVISRYEAEEVPSDVVHTAHEHAKSAPNPFSLTAVRSAPDSYWDMLAELDQDEALDTEDMLQSLPVDIQDTIVARSYTAPADVRSTVVEAHESMLAARAEGQDVVV